MANERIDGTIQCFSCGKDLVVEFPDEKRRICDSMFVSNALWFDADGNYGSRIFDPLPPSRDERIRIAICDDCITTKGEQVRHLRFYRKTEITERSWPEHIKAEMREDKL